MLTDEERRVKVNASKLAYYYRNAAKLNADRCGWDHGHPEQANARHRRYYAADPKRYCATSARCRSANPEKSRVAIAKYTRNHPQVRSAIEEKRRAAKYANTPISEMLTSIEWLAILAEADGHCAYCDKEAKLTLDHVIPLSQGGKHSASNVVPACGHCNSSKGNKTLEEWNAKRLTQAKK